MLKVVPLKRPDINDVETVITGYADGVKAFEAIFAFDGQIDRTVAFLRDLYLDVARDPGLRVTIEVKPRGY